jgi:acyl-[acyl-carrier-protein]-phospholipid O-acyltransferase/long-chain-fatty-acid--[acyl-carrier-protein] ligase
MMNISLSHVFHKILPFFLVRFLLRLCCRVEVIGLEHFHAAGSRVLIIANHVSNLDAVLLSAFLPGRILFATHAGIAHRWWLKPYWHIGDDFSLDQANAMTAKKMVDALKQGQKCMIFPEGRLTTTGGLMKVYESPGMIADKAEAKILPIRIDGPQYSFFSALHGSVRRRVFPQITLTILPASPLVLPEEIKGPSRRHLAGTKIYDILERTMVEGAPYSTMLRQLLATRSLRGGDNVILEDATRAPIVHDEFVAKFFLLARLLARVVGKQEKAIGIMMPNGIPNATAIFAIQALDRITAMINFTSGPSRIVQACQMAPVRTVLTLRSFIEAQQLDPVIAALTKEQINVIYLEDLLASINPFDRFIAFAKAHVPASVAACGLSKSPKGPALMLFTSGTEGRPKGVMLSHLNVIANGFQTGTRLGFSSRDSSFACLPMFHSFGLTLGFFMPLFFGTRAFLFPSPLRYHDIPELVYDTGATLLLGTDTFLANYEKNATPHDFYFLRYVIGGAEKIKPETRRVWAEKFGVRLFEGYGTTEATPVISVNSPMYYKAGSIGRVLPCLDVKLQSVEGIKDGAELVVRGINVMMGYVSADNPGVIQPPAEGWYNTGDVVSIDENGFITILGRTKRFAKVAGEMVSLGAIEAVVCALWPDRRHVAVSVPHERKGEMVVLLTESDDVELDGLSERFRTYGLTELFVPRKLIKVDQIPLLGSGKTDYTRARQIAEESLRPAVEA